MNPNIKVFEPQGNLDGLRVKQLRQVINDSLENDADIILIDLKSVTFMDSSGLSEFVLIQKSVRTSGKKLFLYSISAPVRILFDLTSMERVFDIFPDRDALDEALLSVHNSEKQGD